MKAPQPKQHSLFVMARRLAKKFRIPKAPSRPTTTSPMRYVRKGATISDHTGKKPVPTPYASINMAKRKSRDIQMAADGALGRGTVRVHL